MASMFLDELEAMASAMALPEPEVQPPVNDEAISRWQKLFAMGPEEASEAMNLFRKDVNRVQLTNGQWNMMAANATGHDKESFEYHLTISKSRNMNRQQGSRPAANASRTANPDLRWLYIPIPPLDTLEKIRTAMPSCSENIEVVKDDSSQQEFILCNIQLKNMIVAYLHNKAPAVRATFVAHSVAAKQLAPHSAYPTLGLETTLPQFRASSGVGTPQRSSNRVQQHDYPVFYFFYGTLSDPERLVRLLKLENEPKIQKACVQGGVLKEWTRSSGDGCYKALMNGPADSVVSGSMVEIQNDTQEMALRTYETARYEIVRCLIKVEGGPDVQGLTFRFVDYGELWQK